MSSNIITNSDYAINLNSGANTLSLTGVFSATGNVAGNFFIGNGSQLTGIAAASSYGNSNVVANLAALGTNPVSTTGNITGGNVLTGGLISVTGNITGGNILGGANVNATTHTGTTVSVTANVTGGNILTGGLISATGNITGGNLLTGGLISSTGNITGGNLQTTGLISATGNITGNNLTAGTITLSGNTISSTDSIITIDPASVGNTGGVIIQGNLSVTGNVTYIDSNTITTNDLVINMANNAATAAAANGGGIGVGPVTGAYATITYNSTSNTWVISNGANISGAVSASGNITGGNVLGGANVNATTHTGTTVSVSANVTGGNILTAGLISATGNITGGNLSGTNIVGTLTTAAQTNITSVGTLGSLTVTANTTSGNLLTGGLISATGNITGNFFIGNGSQLTGIAASYGNSNVVANVAALGTNPVSTTGNITGGNVLGGANVNATTHTGTTVSVSANVTGGNILFGSGIVSGTGNIFGGNLTIAGNTATITTASYSIGYLNVPQVSLAANATIALTDSGKHYYSTSASNLTLTVADNSAVSWPVGTSFIVVNRGTGNITVAPAAGVSLYLAGNSTSASRVLTTYNLATCLNLAANVWMISGSGLV